MPELLQAKLQLASDIHNVILAAMQPLMQLDDHFLNGIN